MLRNREFRLVAVFFCFIAAAAAGVGFCIDLATGILLIIFAAAVGTAFFTFTKARYKSIAQISEQIDLVLHNVDKLYIGETKEGELSILQKMSNQSGAFTNYDIGFGTADMDDSKNIPFALLISLLM